MVKVLSFEVKSFKPFFILFLKLFLLLGFFSLPENVSASQYTSIHDASNMNQVLLDRNKPFEEQVKEANTIYVIRYSFDLKQKDIVLPDNIVLSFEGGCIKNFKAITFNRAYIDAAPYQLFYFDDMIDMGNLTSCNGEFNSCLLAGENGGILNEKMPIEWFGAKADSDNCSAESSANKYGTDCSSALQFAINTSFAHRNAVYITPSRHHYYIKNTIYLPPSFSVIGNNYAYALNSFGNNDSYASELFFSCKYLFRSKKYKGQTEQERLHNYIKANIDGVAIHGVLTAPPRARSIHEASPNSDVYSYNSDYYWEKKTYVFFGCIINGGSLKNLKIWGVGTFIYGAVRGLTRIENNTIRYSRNLICGAAGQKKKGRWNTYHDFPLVDGTQEVEFGSASSYTLNGVKYYGYEEPVECYTSKSNSISSYDVTIENNNFTCSTTRCITFYEIAPEQVTIENNYIDFAFAVFAFKTQSELRVFHNTFDYCYIVFLSRAYDKISFVSNAITRCTRKDIFEGSKYHIAWWDNDYSTAKAYNKSGGTDGKSLSSTGHKGVAFAQFGGFKTGYIRNTIISNNVFAGVDKFYYRKEDVMRMSSDISILGNSFDPNCDKSFMVKFTNGDAIGDENSYSGEGKNIYIQQWEMIELKDHNSFPKYSQSPSHSLGTWLSQNINSVFVDQNTNNSYYLVGDTYIPINPVKSTAPLISDNSMLLGELVPGSTGLVYDDYSKRYGMVINAANEPNGRVAIDGEGFVLMKKRHDGWVKTTEEGYQQYNTTIHRWGYYYNGSFLDFDGYHFANRSGTSVLRPTNALSPSDVGFEYYDTDLRAPIYFTIINGVKKWITTNGVDVTNVTALRGTSTQRKSMWLNSDNEGLQFYDTTLKKWVLFNGTQWTNLDGSPL